MEAIASQPPNIITLGRNRVLIEDAISKEDASSLAQVKGELSWEDPRIQEPLDWVKNFFEISIGAEAYVCVEDRPEGHPWHVDTGTSDHMMWCRYSASIVLTDGYTGGGFYFRDIGPIHHYLGLVTYTSDNEHMVESHKGQRKVLLMFFNG